MSDVPLPSEGSARNVDVVNQPLDVSGAVVEVSDDGSFAISSTPLSDALASNGNDELLVDTSNSEPIEVSDDGSFAISATPLDDALSSNNADEIRVDTTPSEPVQVSDTAGDGPVSGTTSTAGQDVTLTLDGRDTFDIYVDTSGDATLTVEVRSEGGTWRPFDTVSYTGASEEVEQFVTAFYDVRASVNQNLNTLEMSGK
jgi:hypothetical protein